MRAVAASILLSVVLQPVRVFAAEPGGSRDDSVPTAPSSTPVANATHTPTAKPLTRDRGAAAAAAVVPGIVLHGSGHYALGHKKTALALLIGEGLGLVLTVSGYGTLRASGNSRYLAGPAVAATVFGAGLLLASFGADLYGTLATDGDAVDRVPRAPARFESELGYRYVADPHFSYAHFVVESLTLRQGHFRLTPSAWFATNSENVRYRVEAAYRLVGLEPGELGKRDDHVDLVFGGLHQRYVPERFQRSGIELLLDTRFDLSHLGDTLRGSFIDLGLGYGIAKVTYDIAGVAVPADTDDLLLLKVGLGVALRGRAAAGSEARLYYDHRHDDYAAGFLTPGRISGVFGKFGADLRWFFTPRLGVLLDAQVGSAMVGGLSLLLREGTLASQGTLP
ncbi:MAG TPA: hypothetical protein VER11_03085 [Polyangiaceae bacterium]|nr:hypothetical protein [Polyangiaceae bacterium]